jgi:nucleoside-diphosphate-sugar epimerase
VEGKNLSLTSLPAWLDYQENRVAIIGATGWVGRALVDVVFSALAEKQAGKLRLFGSRARTLSCDGQDLTIEPLQDGSQLGPGNWIVLHAAIVGPDRFESEGPAAIRTRNDQLLDRVFSLVKSGQTHKFVYFSSGAAGRPPSGPPERQAYSVMKSAQEQKIVNWSKLNRINIIIPRIFNLAGPYINHFRDYAIGDFISKQYENGFINIKSNGLVIRNYVHVIDMAQVITSMAIESHSLPTIFDVCTSDIVELDALAMTVARAFGVDPETIIRNEDPDRPVNAYLGAGDIYQQRFSELGLRQRSLSQMVQDTITYLKDNGQLGPVGVT